MTADFDSEGLRTEEALRLLASDERRRLLVELHDRDGEEPLFDDEAARLLFEDVVEEPIPNGDEETRERERLAIRLHHNHLPRLAEKSVIEWDDDANTIRAGPVFEDLRPFVETFSDRSDW